MSLFRRVDGDPIPDLSPVRRLMPHLLPGRNESAVYYEQSLDLSATLPFIASYNQRAQAAGQERVTLFHLVLWATGRVLHERPGLNRFAAGGDLYQRRGAQVSFAAKKERNDRGDLATVKLEMPAGEALATLVERVLLQVSEGRQSRPGQAERGIDREVRLLTRLPGPVLGAGMRGVRWLDRLGLLPEWFVRDDPLFCSVFWANLGSLGLDAAWHHLYEYGTASLFAVLGAVRGNRVTVRYTYDERINDGFYCVAALERLRELIERPEQQGAL
jgi:hypothetical protein